MRILIEQEQQQVGAGGGEPTTPPSLSPPREEIDEILDQLRHLNDRPGTV